MTGSRGVTRSLIATGVGAAVAAGLSRLIVGTASGPEIGPAPLLGAAVDYATAAALVLGVVMAAAAASFGLVRTRLRSSAQMSTAVGAGFVGAGVAIEAPRWLLVPEFQDRRMDLSASAAAFVDRFADVLNVAHVALFVGAVALVLTLLWLARWRTAAVK